MRGIVWSLLAASSGFEIGSKVRVAVKEEATFSQDTRSSALVKHEVEETLSSSASAAAAKHGGGMGSNCMRWHAVAGKYVGNGDVWDGGAAVCGDKITNTDAINKKLQCIPGQQFMQETQPGDGFVALNIDVTSALGSDKKDESALTPTGQALGCWVNTATFGASWKKIGHGKDETTVVSNCDGTGHNNLFISYGTTGGDQIFSWMWEAAQGKIRYYYPKPFAYGLYKSSKLGDNLIGNGMKAACISNPGICPDLNYCFSCVGRLCPSKKKCPGGEQNGADWSPAQQSLSWQPCALTKPETADEWKNCDPSSHVTLGGGEKYRRMVLRSILSEGEANPRYRLQMVDAPGPDKQPCFLHSILACSKSEEDVQPMGRMFSDPANFAADAPMKVCGLPADA